jgi:4-oxalocrotonate tautomerase
MPFVTIKILKGHPQERKDEMSRRVTSAIAELAGLPREAVWVVFEDVSSEDWYLGGVTVDSIRKAAKP